MESDEEWNAVLDQTEEFKISSNTADIEELMSFHKNLEMLKDGIEKTHAQVLEGLMEGGSRMRLVLRIIRNCLESKW